jgi:hypothetical protein
VTPLERLLTATERLLDDAFTVVESHAALHGCDDGIGITARTVGPNPTTELITVIEAATEAFTVGTNTACVQADTGTKGEVAVQVPVATFPLPLGACLAMAIVPGQLPGPAATQVSCPPEVPSGDDVVNISVSATLAPGLYAGHVRDQSGNLQRPFLIFLDGLA